VGLDSLHAAAAELELSSVTLDKWLSRAGQSAGQRLREVVVREATVEAFSCQRTCARTSARPRTQFQRGPATGSMRTRIAESSTVTIAPARMSSEARVKAAVIPVASAVGVGCRSRSTITDGVTSPDAARIRLKYFEYDAANEHARCTRT
jgi:hypothetical protein